MPSALQRRGLPQPGWTAGILLLAALWGAAVALAGLSAFYLALSLVGCAFVLTDFRIGVVLLILLMPVSRSTLFPHEILGIVGLNPVNLLLAATLASSLARAAVGGRVRQFVPRPLLWLYIAPLVAAAIWGTRHLGDIAPVFRMYDLLDFEESGGYLREFLLKPMLLVIFALLVRAAVAKSARPEKFITPALLAVWTMGLVVLVFVLQSGVGLGTLESGSSRGFLSPLGMHANDFGRMYAIAYALLLFTLAETQERGLRVALFATIPLVIAALVVTFSRGAFLAFAVANLLFLFWSRSLRTALVFALLATVVLLALPEAVYDRLATGSGQGLDSISAGRLEGLWLPLAPEVLHSPLFGKGLGSILWSEAMRTGGGVNFINATHPHNAYLEAALDVGLAGIALLGAFYLHLWRGFRALGADATLDPTLRGWYRGAAAALICLLVADFTDGSLAPRPEQVFLWLAIGMMYGQRKAEAVA